MPRVFSSLMRRSSSRSVEIYIIIITRHRIRRHAGYQRVNRGYAVYSTTLRNVDVCARPVCSYNDTRDVGAVSNIIPRRSPGLVACKFRAFLPPSFSLSLSLSPPFCRPRFSFLLLGNEQGVGHRQNAGRGIRDRRIGGGRRRLLHESRGRREAKYEGVHSLQAGLVPALAFQVVLNGIRLGAYKSAQRYELILDKQGNTDVLRTLLVSGTAGCVGAVLGSPFYLVKTQLQAQSAKSIAVGHQHDHSGSWDAFRSLWKEGGVTALYRGWNANLPRVFVGSATQLTTFGLASDWLRSLDTVRYC
ncbi:PREDICTED: uncharacterized protein LOC106747627 isoform X4 [Dinoponera quadriceps]|uniref:Uncharacterized protein LOC106747627 isoform X4 n=1 Tax=Dinoponera quadriceps TaxID=609295 RepID=A0A6P3XRF6_DINQU|nr:PREDICTED: uncharacterized protein LOC106747627 isoform X4 [Dinoponera quadriceps]